MYLLIHYTPFPSSAGHCLNSSECSGQWTLERTVNQSINNTCKQLDNGDSLFVLICFLSVRPLFHVTMPHCSVIWVEWEPNTWISASVLPQVCWGFSSCCSWMVGTVSWSLSPPVLPAPVFAFSLSFTLSSLCACVSVSMFMGRTHCGFPPLAEHTCYNQSPVLDDLVKKHYLRGQLRFILLWIVELCC